MRKLQSKKEKTKNKEKKRGNKKESFKWKTFL